MYILEGKWVWLEIKLNYRTIYISIVLATRSIEARARQEGRASLYNWIVYKRGSKAKERKQEERKHCLKLYTIFWSRNGNLPQLAII